MRVLFFTNSDTLDVLAATAPYYTLRYLEQRGNVRVFLEVRNNTKAKVRPTDIVYRRSRFLPGLIHVNLPAAWALIRHGVGKEDVVYTYDRLAAPGLLAKLRGRAWVVDFQIPPLEQDLEFAAALGNRGASSLRRYRFRKRLLRFFYRYCDLAVTLNEETRQLLTEDYGIPEAKIHVLQMGVDLERFAPSGRALAWSPFRIVHVGSMGIPALGLEDCLKALARLKSEGIVIQMQIAGRITLGSEQSLRNTIEKLNLSDRVEWLGFVPHERIPELLDQAHAGVSARHDIPSLRASSPAKLVEYLAMGKPAVASDTIAHRRLVRDGWNGLLFRAGDSGDLAIKLRQLAGDRDLYGRLSGHARESVEDLSWNKLLGSWFERLQSVAVR